MTSSKKSLGAAVTAMMLASWVAGCGGSKEEQPPPAPPPPPPAVTPSAPPPPPPPPQPTACDATQSAALTAALQAREKTEAPGMKAEGGSTCMVVGEGQTATGPTVMLEQGYCYTVLAQALPGVGELDLQLVLDPAVPLPAGMQPVLAVDTETGLAASIGPKTSCYAWSLPLQGMTKVVAKARTASSPGPIAFQIYKKKK